MNNIEPNHEAYDANGDLIAKEGQRFRQVGWIINGGPNNGVLLGNVSEERANDLIESLKRPHGGYSPVYIEVGD